jgi:hypothetical protein
VITKVQIVNGSYDELRISGLTVDPSPSDTVKGLKELDAMVAAWTSEGIHIGFKLSESIMDIDPNSDSGIGSECYSALESNLACKLAAAFGKTPLPHLLSKAKQTKDMLYDVELITKQQNPYQPAGQGNNRYGYRWHNNYMPIDNEITVEKDGTLDDLS